MSEQHHMWLIAGVVWAIGQSFTPPAAKASIPFLGHIPTVVKGPDSGLLDGLVGGGGLGGLFGGKPAAGA